MVEIHGWLSGDFEIMVQSTVADFRKNKTQKLDNRNHYESTHFMPYKPPSGTSEGSGGAWSSDAPLAWVFAAARKTSRVYHNIIHKNQSVISHNTIRCFVSLLWKLSRSSSLSKRWTLDGDLSIGDCVELDSAIGQALESLVHPELRCLFACQELKVY